MQRHSIFLVTGLLAVIITAGLALLLKPPAANTAATGSSSSQSGIVSSMISTTANSNESKFNAYSAAPEVLPEEERTGKFALIKTSKGDIKVRLEGGAAPATVSNFIFLANQKFYDNLTFHRVEPGFVVQGGDPLGTGTGGPGYTVTAEVTNGLKHTKGAIAMARLGDEVNPSKASSGSQFYITLDTVDFLDNQYTVFGYVTEGMDEVVAKIAVGDKIESVEIL